MTGGLMKTGPGDTMVYGGFKTLVGK